MEKVLFRFEGIEVDARKLEVTREGSSVELEPKAIRVLLYLIENRDRVVSKDELFEKVWAGVEVTDNALTRVVGQIRKGLGDDARQARYIETIPTVGYRFVGELNEALREQSSQAVKLPKKWHWAWGLVAVAAMLAVGLASSWPKSKQAMANDYADMRQLTSSQGLDTGPTLSPDGKLLAYSSDRSGQFEIYVKSLESVDRELQITNDGGPNLEAAWSPDGKWIAYHCVARGGICMVPARGGAVRELAAIGSQPAWSPDSKKILFRDAPLASNSPVDLFPYMPGGVTILDIESGSKQQLRAGTGENFGYPVWSSHPDWIVHAVLAFKKGSRIDAVNIKSGQRHLLADVKGITCSVRVSADRKRLYYTRSTPPSYFGFFSVELDPQTMKPETQPLEVVRLLKIPMRIEVSRDDRKLLFSAADHESNLHRIRVDGGGSPQRVTQSRHFRETGPSFSADGKHLTYEARNIGQQSEIWTANLDGSDEQRVSDPAQPGGMPVWSEDGKSIYVQRLVPGGYMRLDLASRTVKLWQAEAATRNPVLQMYTGRRTEVLQQEIRDGALQLSFVDLASGKSREVPSAGSNFGFGRLSPNGKLLAGALYQHGFAHFGLLPAEGGSPKQLTKGVERAIPHGWSPDGKEVSFAGMRQGAWNIFAMNVETGEERQLTNYKSLRAFVRYPAWSPKNDWIVYELSEMKGNIFELDLPPR